MDKFKDDLENESEDIEKMDSEKDVETAVES